MSSEEKLEKRVLIILIVVSLLSVIVAYCVYDCYYGDSYQNKTLMQRNQMSIISSVNNLKSTCDIGMSNIENKLNNVPEKRDWNIVDINALSQPKAPGFGGASASSIEGVDDYYSGIDSNVQPGSFSKFIQYSNDDNDDTYMTY